MATSPRASGGTIARRRAGAPATGIARPGTADSFWRRKLPSVINTANYVEGTTTPSHPDSSALFANLASSNSATGGSVNSSGTVRAYPEVQGTAIPASSGWTTAYFEIAPGETPARVQFIQSNYHTTGSWDLPPISKTSPGIRLPTLARDAFSITGVDNIYDIQVGNPNDSTPSEGDRPMTFFDSYDPIHGPLLMHFVELMYVPQGSTVPKFHRNGVATGVPTSYVGTTAPAGGYWFGESGELYDGATNMVSYRWRQSAAANLGGLPYPTRNEYGTGSADVNIGHRGINPMALVIRLAELNSGDVGHPMDLFVSHQGAPQWYPGGNPIYPMDGFESNSNCTGRIPEGTRLRLKGSFTDQQIYNKAAASTNNNTQQKKDWAATIGRMMRDYGLMIGDGTGGTSTIYAQPTQWNGIGGLQLHAECLNQFNYQTDFQFLPGGWEPAR